MLEDTLNFLGQKEIELVETEDEGKARVKKAKRSAEESDEGEEKSAAVIAAPRARE